MTSGSVLQLRPPMANRRSGGQVSHCLPSHHWFINQNYHQGRTRSYRLVSETSACAQSKVTLCTREIFLAVLDTRRSSKIAFSARISKASRGSGADLSSTIKSRKSRGCARIFRKPSFTAPHDRRARNVRRISYQTCAQSDRTVATRTPGGIAIRGLDRRSRTLLGARLERIGSFGPYD